MAGPSTGRRLLYCITIFATLANFSVGTYLSWTSIIFTIYKQEGTLSLKEGDVSWICCLTPLGAVAGSLLARCVANKIGRKRSIAIFSIVLVAGWAAIGLGGDKVWIFSARVVGGIGCGAFSIIITIYLEEIVDGRCERWLSVIYQLQVYLGTLFVSLTGLCFDSFRIAVLCATVPTILFVASFFLPESPVWLMTRNRKIEADKVMERLNRSQDVTEEDTREVEQSCCVSRCCELREYKKATFIALSLISIQQMSGEMIFIGCATAVLRHLRFPLNPIHASIITGLILVIATCFINVLLNLMRTKLLLHLSLTVMSICLFVMSVYLCLQNRYEETSRYNWVPFLFILLFLVVYAVGCEPTLWITIGRIFPKNVRNLAIECSTVCNWLFISATVGGLQYFTSMMGISTVFAMYGMSTLMGVAFVAAMVPEMEGKTEEELQMKLRGRRQEDSEVPTCC